VKRIIFVIILLFILLQIVSLSLLKLGHYFYNNGGYEKAKKFYFLSYTASLSLNQKAKNLYYANKSQKEQAVNVEKKYNISPSEITIMGKRIVQHKYINNTVITLSAILKNNAEIGIPIVKIKKLTIYDKSHKEVATKTKFEQDISPLVYQGEFPFSILLSFDKSQVIEAEDFEIELDIPAFTKNDKVIRLNVLDQKIMSFDTVDLGKTKSFQYKYKVTIENNTDKEVDNINRVSFLKHKDIALTRMGDVCCHSVKFETQSNNKDVLSLDQKDFSYSLKAYEKKEYEFQISSDEVLYDVDINPKNIQLVVYFVGVVK
jgi:hypothetical protein